jgi:hypothetical protein
MGLRGEWAVHQLACDVLVGQPGGDEPEHLALAHGERGQPLPAHADRRDGTAGKLAASRAGTPTNVRVAAAAIPARMCGGRMAVVMSWTLWPPAVPARRPAAVTRTDAARADKVLR